MKTLKQRLEEGQPIQRAIDNLNICYQKRDSRLKKRIAEYLKNENTYFITFTISPKCYHLKYNTILLKIKKALAGACALGWVLNSDYGDGNDRLHFHAVATFIGQLDYNIIIDIYQYGSVNFEKVYNNNEKALREYLLKTFNHTVKQTIGKIYYSRRKTSKKPSKLPYNQFKGISKAFITERL